MGGPFLLSTNTRTHTHAHTDPDGENTSTGAGVRQAGIRSHDSHSTTEQVRCHRLDRVCVREKERVLISVISNQHTHTRSLLHSSFPHPFPHYSCASFTKEEKRRWLQCIVFLTPSEWGQGRHHCDVDSSFLASLLPGQNACTSRR